jgi:hypothetical protein
VSFVEVKQVELAQFEQSLCSNATSRIWFHVVIF